MKEQGKSTAKQEFRTKIQQIKYHLFNTPRVKVFMCVAHVLYFQDICMVQTHIRGQQLHLLLFQLQYHPSVCLICCIPGFRIIFTTFLSLVAATYLHPLPACSCPYYFAISGAPINMALDLNLNRFCNEMVS